jgi:hypothetical protein
MHATLLPPTIQGSTTHPQAYLFVYAAAAPALLHPRLMLLLLLLLLLMWMLPSCQAQACGAAVENTADS